MKITKQDIEGIATGESRLFTCSGEEVINARSYLSQHMLRTGERYTTKYDRERKEFTITHEELTINQ